MSGDKTIVCPRCGDSFTITLGEPRRVYCRPDCGHAKLICELCRCAFTGKLGRRFCSAACAERAGMADQGELLKWDDLGPAERIAELARLRLLLAMPHPRTGLLYDYRVVAARALGRPLRKGEAVHHEDLDRNNNHPTNLIVFPTEAEHKAHHKLGHRMRTTCTCTCIRLGELAQ